MSNFDFLKDRTEYALFSRACIEAEKVYATSPAKCAIRCREALELAVKWVYAADSTMTEPYRDNLQSLIHEDSFMYAVDQRVWRSLQYVILGGTKIGISGLGIWLFIMRKPSDHRMPLPLCQYCLIL